MRPRRFSAETVIFSDWQRSQRGKSIYYNLPLAPLTIRCFTTNVKGNNNLRDFYYRDIVLGEQNEEVYNPTNNFEIALAFREAGEAFGS